MERKYSEDDLRNIVKLAREEFNSGKLKYNTDEIIQSLKQPKTPKWFVAKREKVYHANRKGITEFQDAKGFYSWKLKTTIINNKTYLVGNYLFK